MPTRLLRATILLCLLTTTSIAQAQKDIIISDSLNANSEKLKVKMGSQGLGKIWKFKFGNYAVISSNAGWTVTSNKAKLFNAKTESKSTKKFSFLMGNKLNDTAKVNAANNISAQYLSEFEIFSISPTSGTHLFLPSSELSEKTINFSAYITINEDTSEIWALFMNTTSGNNAPATRDAFLTNGERKILITPASSNKNGSDTRSMPALGYEFTENGQPLSALQYYGGGMLGLNKNIVWIHNGLDEKIKLILAAASTAILQIETDMNQEKM